VIQLRPFIETCVRLFSEISSIYGRQLRPSSNQWSMISRNTRIWPTVISCRPRTPRCLDQWSRALHMRSQLGRSLGPTPPRWTPCRPWDMPEQPRIRRFHFLSPKTLRPQQLSRSLLTSHRTFDRCGWRPPSHQMVHEPMPVVTRAIGSRFRGSSTAGSPEGQTRLPEQRC